MEEPKNMEKLWQDNTQINGKINRYANKGITLIALIIMVIVLLILAGVTLNLTLRRKGNI